MEIVWSGDIGIYLILDDEGNIIDVVFEDEEWW